MLKTMIPDSISLIDTGAAVARQLQRLLAERDLLAKGPNRPVRFWTSADPAFFRKTLPLLGQVAGDVQIETSTAHLACRHAEPFGN